jgi:protein gp37
MGADSNIEWTDHTFNPWIGCQKVGPGCDHCYAEAMMADRYGRVEWGPHGSRQRTSPANWKKPLAWDRAAAKAGRRDRVFCASLADVFDNHGSITSDWRGDLWRLIHRTPNLDWLLLTKRPGNILDMLPDGYGAPAWGEGWPNVWLGCTVVNQAEADRDIPKLLAVPAAVHFLSMEPLLGPVDLTSIKLMLAPDVIGARFNALTGRYNGRLAPKDASLDWIICGGESGLGARPMHPDWARSLRDQCQAAGVAFQFKQWGEWGPDTGYRAGHVDREMEGRDRCAWWDGTAWQIAESGFSVPKGAIHGQGEWVYRKGKARAGRLLDDREWNEIPGVIDA